MLGGHQHSGSVAANRTLSLIIASALGARLGDSYAMNVTIVGEPAITQLPAAPQPVISPSPLFVRFEGSVEVTMAVGGDAAPAGAAVFYTVYAANGGGGVLHSYTHYDAPVHLPIGVWVVSAYVTAPNHRNSSTTSSLYTVRTPGRGACAL